MSDTAFTLAPRSLPRSRPRFRLVGVSGSTRRPSRTTSLVETLAAEVTRQCSVQFELHDLAGMGAGIGAFSREALPPEAEAALTAIEAADALIVGTPIYKGSYTGLFKHLFDFLSPDALQGKPVALTATGGGRRHALALEHQLRPLFGFFAALTLPTSVYASEEDMAGGEMDAGTQQRMRQAASELAGFAVSSRRRSSMAEIGLHQPAKPKVDQ